MRQDAKTVVVTGAGAGAGRAIATRFGQAGWRVGLIARSAERLADAAAEVEAAGGAAMALPLDVSDFEAVRKARDEVVGRWGGMDAWINAAMATVVAPVSSISPAEYRRATEVTYLGCVHGTLVALDTMQAQGRGAIVQVGSALAYRAIPLQSAYCAAKFAIRGFSDSLRAELIHMGSAVTVTMLQMPGMNTPQFDWARDKMGVEYQPVGAVFDPSVAGEAAWRAVRDRPRELWVGSSAVEAIVGQALVPALLDRRLARIGWEGQLTSQPRPPRPDNLFEPAPGHSSARGRFGARARPRALIVDPVRARRRAAVAIALAGAGLAWRWASARKERA